MIKFTQISYKASQLKFFVLNLVMLRLIYRYLQFWQQFFYYEVHIMPSFVLNSLVLLSQLHQISSALAVMFACAFAFVKHPQDTIYHQYCNQGTQ